MSYVWDFWDGPISNNIMKQPFLPVLCFPIAKITKILYYIKMLSKVKYLLDGQIENLLSKQLR